MKNKALRKIVGRRKDVLFAGQVGKVYTSNDYGAERAKVKANNLISKSKTYSARKPT